MQKRATGSFPMFSISQKSKMQKRAKNFSSFQNKFGKKGQQTFGMSFGMMFSIFLIIIIISVAIYAIVKFVDIGNCAKAGLFYDELQDELDRAWSSGSGSYSDDAFELTLDRTVDSVCFGDPTSSVTPPDSLTRELKEDLEDYPEYNVFLNPSEEICDGLSKKKLNHARFDKFFCEKVSGKGKITIKIIKSETASLVTIENTGSIT